MKVITITNMKGGVGKTTSTIEIGSILQSRGYNVLVIDMDPQMSITTDLGLIKSKEDVSRLNRCNIFEVIRLTCPFKEAIIEHELFDIIPGSKDTDLISGMYAKDNSIVDMLKNIAELMNDEDNPLELEKKYDFVLIDNVPLVGAILTMTYIAADYCIIPTFVDADSVNKAIITGNTIKKMSKDYNIEVMGYILSNCNKRSTVGTVAVQTLEEVLEGNEFLGIIPQSSIYNDIKSLKTSAYKIKKSIAGSREYYRITDIIIERCNDAK